MKSWLSGLLLEVTLLGQLILTGRKTFHVKHRVVLTKLATYVLLVLIGIEILALVRWVIHPFMSTQPYWDVFSLFAYVEENLFNVTLFLCPTLLLVTLYMWVAKFLRRFFTKEVRLSIERKGRVVSQKRWGLEQWKRLLDKIKVEGLSLPFQGYHRYVLVFAIALSILIPLYPYHPGLNPEGRLVGVDAPHYLTSLNDMIEGPPTEVFTYLFWERRGGATPLYLFLLYLARITTGLETAVIISLQPMFLALLLTVSTYFLVREATDNEDLASFSALFTPLTFQTTAMMFGAFYANWLALAEMYVSLGLLLKFFRGSSWKPLVGVALTSIALLYTHPWTWDLFIAVLGCYLLITLVKGKGMVRSRVLPLALILAVNIAAGAVKTLMGSFSGFNAGYNIMRASDWIGLSQLAAFWPNLTITLRHYLAGYLGNPVVLALAMLGVTSIFFVKKDFHWILGSWLALTSILLPLSSHAMQGRLLLNLPFQFLLTYGVAIITSRMGNKTLTKLIVLAAILVNLNYTLRSLANLL